MLVLCVFSHYMQMTLHKMQMEDADTVTIYLLLLMRLLQRFLVTEPHGSGRPPVTDRPPGHMTTLRLRLIV